MRRSTLIRLAIIVLIGIADAVILLILFSVRSSQLTQASDSAIQSAVAATVSAQSAAQARQSPTLTTPASAQQFNNAAAVILKWTWMRPLADDEFFDLRVWHDGDPANGITWTKDLNFNLRDWLLYQKSGDFDWTVGVVQKGADGSGTEITDPAPEQ